MFLQARKSVSRFVRSTGILLVSSGLLGLLVCLVGTSPVLARAGSSDLVISEINPFGSVNTTNCKTVATENRCSFDKWLEIHNPSQEVVNLKGWSLQFRGSRANGDVLRINQNIVLNPGDFYLIGYKEVNYQSTVAAAGVQPGGITGKLRLISNRETGNIQVSLLNPAQVSVFDVRLNAATYPELFSKTQRYSLEYNSGVWQIASNQFYPDNFGTPQNTIQGQVDLDNQLADQIGTAVPPDVNPKNPDLAPNLTEQVSATEPTPKTLLETALDSSVVPKPVTTPTPIPTPTQIPEAASNPSPKLVVEESTEPSVLPTQPSIKVETPTGSWVADNSRIYQLIQRQAAVFGSTRVLQIGPDHTNVTSTRQTSAQTLDQTSAVIASIPEKVLWEYFFSYQALGLLAILFAIAFAFSERESIKLGLVSGSWWYSLELVSR